MRSKTSRTRLAALGAALCLLLPPFASAAEDPADPSVAARIARAQQRRAALGDALAKASGARRMLLEDELLQHRLETQQLLADIATELGEKSEAGEEISDSVGLLSDALRGSWTEFSAELDARTAAIGAQEETEDEFARWEQRHNLLESYRAVVSTIVTLEPLGVDVDVYRAETGAKLQAWAEDLMAETRLAARRQQFAAARSSAIPDDADRQKALRVADDRVEEATTRLGAVVALMEQVGAPANRYQEALISITGQIDSRVLDVSVATGLLSRLTEQLIETLASGVPRWLFKLLVFASIIAVFRFASSLTRRFVERSVNASNLNLSQLLRETVIAWSGRAVMLIGLLVAIAQLGVEIGALVAGLGIAGFVLGFALQDTLSNFAAGAMILIYRPFDVGDLIEAAGARGFVQKMTLVSTTVITVDNQTLILPNTKIWGDVILNVTAQKIRRVDLLFGVGYADDIDRVENVLRDIVAQNERTLEDPPPDIQLHELGDSSVNFIVRPWVKTDDYWQAYWEITREVKRRFDAEGISIPFPQRDVHHYVERATPAD